MMVDLRFGPNGLNGQVREDLVSHYAVYMNHPETGERVNPPGATGDMFTMVGAITFVPKAGFPEPEIISTPEGNLSSSASASASAAVNPLCCNPHLYIVRVVAG